MYRKQENNTDMLRARFTAWLDTVLYHAKLRYIGKQKKSFNTVSLDSLDESSLSVSYDSNIDLYPGSFDFEEERLARIFAQLPVKRQRVLEMIFVENKKLSEIAKILNCSRAYIYNEKYKALIRLRTLLSKDGDEI